MQKVTVPYGEGSLSFPVDDGIEITRLELNDCPPLADFSAELERVLAHPTGSAPLREKRARATRSPLSSATSPAPATARTPISRACSTSATPAACRTATSPS